MENLIIKVVIIIGQWENRLRHGKGIYYNSNGEIKYEGEWINGNFVGN